MSDTPTPRTDAEIKLRGSLEYISLYFARTLERELAAANAENERLRREVEEAKTERDGMGDAAANYLLSNELPDDMSKALHWQKEEIDRLKTEVGDYMLSFQKAASERDTLAARVAELERDRERLDWLERNHIEFAEELNRLGWRASNDAQWEKLKLFLRRIRSVIDAARANT